MKANLLSRSAIALIALAAVGAQPALAADSLYICQPGVPFVYPVGGANIPWNPDLGALGPLSNAQAVAAVDAAFDAWQNLPQSSASFAQGAALAADVTLANFGPIYSPVAPNGVSEIVFDADGSIFTSLFGAGSGILGFAGPDFGNSTTCELLEGSAFLNGPEFTDALVAEDIMVHEFGHYVNLGHVELNGQLVAFSEGGDQSGPTPDSATFGLPSSFLGTEVIETMYPFYFGSSAVGTRTPHADDIASIATLYPAAGFVSATGSISGTIYAANGTTRLSGVNVIARRLNAAGTGGDGDLSFTDAVSTFSGAQTGGTDQSDPNVGVYTLTNLTPGASYAVFVDTVTALAGRFSNPIRQPLPGPEEYYDLGEANANPPDAPLAFAGVAVAAGSPTTGIDVIFNQPQPGEPLQVGDDGFVELGLPFSFCIKGQSFDSVFVNANGNLTFGAGSTDFTQSDAEFLSGPPRIAALWDDLSPFNLITGAPQGLVTFDQTPSTFRVIFQDVPEFLNTGANSFEIRLADNSCRCDDRSRGDDGDDDYRDGGRDGDRDGDRDRDGDGDRDRDRDRDRDCDRDRDGVRITYGDISATDGLAGISGGLAVTSGSEVETDLSALGGVVDTSNKTAVWENFDASNPTPNDLGNTSQLFKRVGEGFTDKFEKNNSLRKATPVRLPFDTLDTKRAYSAIDPPAGDIDFYRMHLEEGTTLVANVTRGQIDSVMGLWFCEADEPRRRHRGRDRDRDDDGDCDPAEAVLVAANDDSNGLLSKIQYTVPVSGTYAVGVTFCCDLDFDGVDPGQGPPFDGGRYVLDLKAVDGVPLALGDDNSVEAALGFSFPFQGSTYNSVFVNSNGNLTFGSGDADFSESVSELLSDQPRIAALWDDLSPNNAGLVIVKSQPTSWKVSFVDVPEFSTTGANNFSITLAPSGQVTIEYGSVTAADGLVGVTQGGGAADPGETNFSAGGPFTAVGTTYEQFLGGGDPFDLSGQVLVFANP